ncbi:hypothetical protein [Chitinophaga ginsengisoli]|nr:hypothetical protein [Chitinophaga ginsengisoli]
MKNHNIIKSYLAGILCLCGIGSLYAQNATNQPALMNITPPSPNAASLGKFGDIQIGPSTGIPQINVPIYSYKNANSTLKLDISLDYHAGGIKVDEVASNVGSGWALGAGGVITRTVRDIYDEATGWGYLNSVPVPTEYEGNARGGFGTSTSLFNAMATHNADGQYDIFSFNFAGRSGKFIYGKNNDFLMLTSNKLKIVKEYGALVNGSPSDRIGRFTITDENGIKYVFDAVELSDDGSAQNYHVWTSAWYLTKIVSPSSRDSIVLEYDDEYTTYTAGKFVTMTYGLGTFPSKTQETSYSNIISNGKRIKKISFPDGVFTTFIYDTADRQDMQSSYGLVRLKQINVSDGTYTRGYNLYHDYSLNRLTLKKVLPYSMVGEEKGYLFDYNGVLPNRLDNNQDHWGFYNTNAANDMLPVYREKTSGDIIPGGNRNTDPVRARAGSLKRMTYPTGGYTDFEMESNTSADARLTDSTITYIREKSFSSSIYCSSGTPATEPFTYNGDPSVTTTFNAQIILSADCDLSSNDCYFVIQVRNSSNQVLTTQTINNDGSYNYLDYPFVVANLTKGASYNFYVYTVGMNYHNYITLSWKELHNQNPDTIKTINKQLYIGGLRVKSIKNYDGINTSPVTAKEFEYLKDDSTTSSGALGVIPEYEHDVFYESEEETSIPPNYHPSYSSYGLTNAIVRCSSPTQTLASINGSPVTYSRVVEKQLNNGVNNGRIVRYFSSYPPGSLGGYNVFPFTPPTNTEWGYGELEKELVFDNLNNLLKTTENVYVSTINDYYSSQQRVQNFTAVALGPVKYQIYRGTSFGWGNIKDVWYYASRVFTPASGRRDLIKTTVTENLSGQSLVTEVSYTYDTAFNIKVVTGFNSVGDKMEKVNYYPYEYNTTVANAMKAQNMIALEIAAENWRTKGAVKYLVGGYSNQYIQHASGIRNSGIAAFNSTNAITSTSVVAFNPASFNRDTSLFKNLISFSQYTSKGYLNEQSKLGDAKHAYIYGYKGNYVIAESINAGVNEIAYSGFDEDGKGNWSYAGAPVTDAAALSGNKVYNLSTGAISVSGLDAGRLYKVSYWSKSAVAASINGTATIKGDVRNGWTYFEHFLPSGATSATVQGAVIIDDLRLYPLDATMATYTYQPLYGMISSSDHNGNSVYYLYDGFGRLKVVKDALGRILKQYDYQFQTSNN